MFCRQNVWEKRAHSRAVCALMDGWIHTCMHAENIFYPKHTHTQTISAFATALYGHSGVDRREVGAGEKF